MDKLIKCTNGIRFRFVTEKLFNSPAFKRTDWRKVEEVETPPMLEQKPKQTKARKIESPVIKELLTEIEAEESAGKDDLQNLEDFTNNL